jgi:tRNA pseudouridine65 synthase
VNGSTAIDPAAEPLEEIAILHRDEDLVVVSKPAGLTVHRDQFSGRHERFVLQTVSDQIGAFLFPVHRLDRNTSGVLCFALRREMARPLHENLQSDASHKEYVTLVRGEFPEHLVSDRPLTGRTKGEKVPARTDFFRLAHLPESRCSLLRAVPATGRHHQIRRHLSHLAHQIIGDSSRGKGRINAFFRDTYGLPRMVLHARRLVVPHPSTGERLEVTDPLAADLRAFLARLPDLDPELLARL